MFFIFGVNKTPNTLEEVMSEYATAGVDYTKLEPFKKAILEAGVNTLQCPNQHGVFILEGMLHAHGALFEYRGQHPHVFCNTQEGLGNKNWIAEWMYANAGTDQTYYRKIGWDTALMAVNDVIAQGAMPVVYTDEVAAGDSDWFLDEARSKDLAAGFVELCQLVGMALPAGESPALRYLIKAEPPVTSAPSLSGCVTGIIAPKSRLITGVKLQAGDRILGAPSTGLHCNGISLVIKRALGLRDQFLTKLPDGKTLGEHALIPTRSYVALVKALLDAGVDIHALLPGTGSGVSKIALDGRPFTYRVTNWVDKIPPLFLYLQELGVSLEDCLKTFNWGIGYYIYLPEGEVAKATSAAKEAGYDLLDLGGVEEGERQVIFEPEDITLPPPGD